MNEKHNEARNFKNYKKETQKWGIKKHSGAYFDGEKKT